MIASDNFDIKLVSKHFIVCSENTEAETKLHVFYVNEVSNTSDPFRQQKFAKNAKYQKVFASDHYSIDVTLLFFKDANERQIFVSKIWYSNDDSELIELDLPFIQLDSSVSLNDFVIFKSDITLANRRNLVLVDKDIFKCYDIGESRRADSALELKSGLKVNSQLSEGDIVQLRTLEKRNRFIAVYNHIDVRKRKIFIIEIEEDFQMQVKKAFEIQNCTNLMVQGNFLFYQSDYDTLVFFNALSFSEMLRMKISVEIKSVQLSEDSRFLMMHFEDNTLRVYHFPNFKLLAKLLQKDLFYAPILNSKFLAYHCNKHFAHVLKFEALSNAKLQ